MAEVQAEDSCLSLRDLAVNGRDLMQLGIPAGKELVRCLQQLLDAVLDDTLPNERDVLLRTVKELLEDKE